MTIISILLVASFTSAAIWKKKELPDSISSLVWLFTGKWRWVWTVWMWAVAVTACIPLISVMPENVKFLGFLTMGCLCFCGAMPLFMKEHKKAHDLLGLSAGIISQICVAIVCPWLILFWVIFGGVLYDALSDEFLDIKPRWYAGKGVFLAEAMSAITVYGCSL